MRNEGSRSIRRTVLALLIHSGLLFFLLASGLGAAPYIHPNGTWLIDPMEGYTVEAKNAPDLIEFKDPSGLVYIHVYTFQPNRFASSKALYTFMKDRYKLKDTLWTGTWADWEWYAATGEMGVNTNGFEAVLQTLYRNDSLCYAVVGFVHKRYGTEKEPEIISALDSFAPTSARINEPGVMSRVSGTLKPSQNPTAVTFGGEPFVVNFGENEIAAMDRLLVREKKILFQLGGTKGPGREAIMQRFYRMIYRNAYPAVERFTEAMKPWFKKKNWPIKDQVGFVWGGTYMYEFQEKNGDDIIVSPFELIQNRVGDCDSKAVLMNMILDQLGAKSEILLSLEEGHATIGLPKEYFAKLTNPPIVKGSDGTPLYYVEVERKYASNPKGKADAISEQWVSLKLQYK